MADGSRSWRQKTPSKKRKKKKKKIRVEVTAAVAEARSELLSLPYAASRLSAPGWMQHSYP